MIKVKKPSIVTGLDIGSSKISAVAGEISGAGEFKIIAQITQPSRGVSRGILADLSGAAASVSKVMSRLREKISAKPDNIYVNLSGQSIKGARSRGMIPISLRGREIIKPDMERCAGVASTIHLPFDREMIHRVVHDFSVDDQSWIKNPLGLYASRLSCEVYVVTADVNHIQNIYKCVNNAGYDIKEVVFTGIADSESLLEQGEKDAGVVILDIGASLAEISIFSNGVLSDIEVIPVGFEDVKTDFRTNDVFNDIVSKIAARIKDFVNGGGKVASIVLTGGSAFNDGLIEFLEEKLLYPVKMGVVKDLRGDISSMESMKIATAIGLARYGYERHLYRIKQANIPKRLSEKVIDIFNNYF